MILPEEEIQRLFYIHRTTKCLKNRDDCGNKLVKSVMPFAVQQIKRSRPSSPYFDDYLAESLLGITHGLRLYDPKRGVKWITYIARIVFGRIIHFDRVQRNTIHVPILAQRTPEGADALKKSKSASDINEYPNLASTYDKDSLIHYEKQEIIKLALEFVNERERDIILSHTAGKTYTELAARYNVTRQRVEQIYKLAVRIVRKKVKDLCHEKGIPFDDALIDS
jgi:RNA polymerase sigma factor (sigma-70 family)